MTCNNENPESVALDPLARYVWVLLVFDAILVALHFITGRAVINLDEEANVSAWYSSAKLLLMGWFCWLAWRQERSVPADRRPGRFTFLWIVLALLFLGLSVDETASLHERLARKVMSQWSVGLDIRETVLGGDQSKDAFAWVLLLSPFIVASLALFLVFLFRRLRARRRGYVPVLAGIAMFATVILLEATIYLFPSFSDFDSRLVGLYRLLVGIEECCEVFGITLFLVGLQRYLSTDPAPAHSTLS
jgi:hypothetical protein